MGKYLQKQYQPSVYSSKRVIQIVCHARSLDHTSQMFCQLDILKIYDLIDFNTCMSVYKVVYRLVPLTLQNKFPMSSSKKSKNNFYVVCKDKKKAFSMPIKSVSLWSSLHNFVNLCSSLRIFNINSQKSLSVNIDFLRNI